MKPEFVSFRIDELLRQLEVEFAPLAREKGLELDIRALLARRCAPTAGCCAGCCRTSSPTPSSTRRRAACWSAAGGAAASCASTSTTPASAFRTRKQKRDLPGVSPARRRAPRWRAASASGSRSSSASRACSTTRSTVDSAVGRGSHFSVEVPLLDRRCRRAGGARRRATSTASQLAGIAVLCIDNEPAILDGMETLLGGWGCRVLKAPDLAAAVAAIDERQGSRPTACWSTIISTRATASRRSPSCAGASAPTCRRS